MAVSTRVAPGSGSRVHYPRGLAVRALTRILSGEQTLDRFMELEARDLTTPARAWLLEIVSGTLRWMGRLSWFLDSLAERKQPTGHLRKALLLASYQLVAQDRIQAAAVVSEWVSYVRSTQGGDKLAGFANAILRRVAEGAPKCRAAEFPGRKVSVQEKAAWASMPVWFWSKLVADHGEQWAADFAASSLERPRVWVRSKGGEARVLPEGGGSITEIEGFQDGEWIVQDISSQTLVRDVTAVVHEAGTGKRALDLCAAPGGKTVGLAWNGWQVTATDFRDDRLGLLRENLMRTRLSDHVRVIPYGDLAAAGEFDLVWVDAPCSSSGLIRRHPDVRWLKKPEEVPDLASTQRELLAQAWKRVKPGGFLAYSVCSVFRDEGDHEIDGGEKVQSWLLAPHLGPDGGDGFTASLWRKGSNG